MYIVGTLLNRSHVESSRDQTREQFRKSDKRSIGDSIGAFDRKSRMENLFEILLRRAASEKPNKEKRN